MTPKLALVVTAVASAGITACGSTSSASPPSTSSPAAAPKAAAAALKVSNKATVAATEYAFAPTALAAKPGKFTVTLDNKGSIPHEFVLLKTDQAPDALKVDGSAKVGEKDAVGEVSETDGGKTKTKTLDLKAGKYVFVCNIPGHYGDGMRGTLTVK